MSKYQKKDFIRIILIAAALTAIFLFLAVSLEPLLNIFSGPIRDGDSEWYIMAANGDLHTLIEPYSVRFLHPFIAGWISRHLSLNINEAFLMIAIVSLFLFLIINAIILKNTTKSSLLIAPLFMLPYFLQSLTIMFHSDAFYMFLTALFFLFLYFKKESMGLLVFFLLFLTRESTALLGLIYAAVSWFFSKKRLAAAIVVILLVSLFTTSVMRDIGEPNKHNLNSSVYLAAKFSYNFMKNVLGLNAWTNTYQNCEPIFKVHMPPLQSFGSIKEIGLCGFDGRIPMQTVTTLLTVFGIAPLVLLYSIRKRMQQIWKTFPLWLVVALVYGLAMYGIGVVAGTGVARIVGFGWPAFVLATPILLKNVFEINRKFITTLLSAHLVVAWMPFVAERIGGGSLNPVIIGIVLIVYYYCFTVMRRQKRVDSL